MDDKSGQGDFYIVGMGTPAGSRYARSSREIEDIYDSLLEECLPPSVLVDEYGELVQICGDGDRYLKVPRGRVSFDIQKMVPKELTTAVGIVISKVRKERRTVTYANIKSGLPEDETNINLVARPLFTNKNGLLILIIFEENKDGAGQTESAEKLDMIIELNGRISDLEQELEYTRKSLQTSVERIETLNDELCSTDEELQAANEELRMVNEELAAVHTRSLADKKLLEEARAFDAIKNDFFGNLSHELRTPLNVIMSTLQLLDAHIKNSPTNEKHDLYIKKHLNIMKQNCLRQLRLVNNMIDITKIDAGFFDVKLQNYDIVNVVENVTLSVSEYIRNKSLELVFDTDFEEKIIACDPNNIERIVLNLLSNAVKFTKEGGSINVNMYDRGDRVLISVKDSGIGIPKEMQEVIFDRFRQVDKSLTKNNEGSGIGLSLVKSLVELHGGMVYVQSEYGSGSEFIIELPVRTVPEDASIVREDDRLQQNVEKIHIEFSDIYNLN